MVKNPLLVLSIGLLFLCAQCDPVVPLTRKQQPSETSIKPATSITTGVSAVYSLPIHSASPKLADGNDQNADNGSDLLGEVESAVGTPVGSVINDPEELFVGGDRAPPRIECEKSKDCVVF
ncbi:uncharacterized protein FOMMEDRAFT_151908 [Fomitiporia mediterranea MF3/22]|uniref:uncharacterized protein n=1 Tax=Fomitiporia mediterranea (strain MF3/22) TaxID=694068 RepID=UPI00044095A7|nr:uncharacterized protein FOMMEDRAFT_151908 [Fomitiporia mediterranea MF3/22]EJD06623.1 hypothetical protein FOMMEDRAFT_151908 [Fomitiporia mediterranea MF3/22]